MNLLKNKPSADILMFSMRSMGYSFESAVADIVDNSISAGAKKIRINFPMDPSECFLTICDDGCGMLHDELFDAMKYGSEKKRKGRSETDLGRFGLGLKSASLSQCRKLTVISKKDSLISGFCWDLDVVEEKRDWYVIELSDETIRTVPGVAWLKRQASGTVVLWENFDIIEKSSGNVYSELSRYQNSVSDYLSLIYHRYLNRTGSGKISMRINNYTLKGLDPFLENHKKTNVRRRIEIPVADSNGNEHMVTVQPFILPFQKDLSDADKKLSGGIENYRTKQGFYVYRNERLIIWGTWFGRPRDELTKYARIRVDIPNTLDDIWGIDIKKQNAKIPNIIRSRLTKAVDEAMDIAIQKQTFRGRLDKADESTDYIWDRIKERDQYSYRINRNSRIFDLIRKKVDDETWNTLDMVLEEIESSLPYQQIYIDKSQNKIDEPTENDERLAEVEEKGKMLIRIALSMGGTKNRRQIVDSLFRSEPFVNYPSLKNKLLEDNEND